jgi:1-deoxyxylulose-5-phosphate synthase
MEYRRLGNTELEVSALAMGGGTFGREIDQDTSHTVMDHALDRGITLFDTAEAYGEGASEQVVGTWLKTRGTRDQITLATKVSGELTRNRVLSSAEESLQRLSVDHVDLFQAHVWCDDVPLEETLEALQLLIEQGKTRYIGCSNYTGDQVNRALAYATATGGPRLESVQPNYNLVTREIESDLLPICEANNLGTISYSPLGAGFLTGKYRQGEEIPTGTRFDVIPGHQDVYFSPENFARVESLRSISEETGRSMVQLALAWVTNQPGITSVLVGARSTSHIDQAFEAKETGLDGELHSRLSSL